MKLIAIVEGYGEVVAVRVLLRRVLQEKLQRYDVGIEPPIRVPKGKLLKPGELERAVDLAARRTSATDGIIVLVDADDDCPAELAPAMATRAAQSRSDRRISVVIAKSEFESWFVAAADSLAGYRGLSDSLVAPANAELIRDAKGWLSSNMPTGSTYRETIDQAAFASRIDLDKARQCPSFDKFMREIRTLAHPSTSSLSNP